MAIVRAYAATITTADIADKAVTQPKVDLSSTDDTNLVLETTGTDTDKPPAITFSRASTTVADDMEIGTLSFRGQNAAPEDIEYVSIAAVSSDVVDGDEGGQLTISCMAGGTAGTAAMKKFMAMGLEDAGTFPALVQVNPVNEDIDFQVRSTTGNNLFRCDSAAHQVAVGDSLTTTSAVLEVRSTTAGFLPPRMSTTQQNAISSPALGLMLYNTTTNKLMVYNGSWTALH